MASASRLENLISSLTSGGFSKVVAERIARSVKSSTLRNYQCKWRVFCDWCRSVNLCPASIDIPRIADFFIFLKDSKKLSLSAIRGYRSMLANTFQVSLGSVGSDIQLSNLIRHFAVNPQKISNKVPSWSLNKVLSYLKRAEPLHSLSFLRLTKKVLFLLFLATARRVSELHALSPKVAFQGSSMILFFKESFLAKTENLLNPLPRFVSVKALRETKNTPELNNSLCPVRCLKYYIKKIKDLNLTPSSLFVSPSKPSREMSKNGMSFFIRDTIISANAVYEEGGPVKAHDLRGIATSMAFRLNVSLTDIMKAATWRSPSTFSNFYLKKVAYSSKGWSALGPFVAAGAVVNDEPRS